MFLPPTRWKIAYMGRLDGNISRCIGEGQEMDFGRCGPTKKEKKKRHLLGSRIIYSQKRHKIMTKKFFVAAGTFFIEPLSAESQTLLSYDMFCTENDVSNNSSIVACIL
jgi:hypothetical protein